MKHKIFVSGDMTDEGTHDLIAAMDEIPAGEDIEIILSSEGGKTYDAIGMYDVLMEERKSRKITITACGSVQSAAVLVLQAGTVRRAYPNTTFMIHPSNITIESPHSVPEVEKVYTELKRVNDLMIRKMLQFTIYADILPENVQFNIYFASDIALKIGLIDEIVGESNADSGQS